MTAVPISPLHQRMIDDMRLRKLSMTQRVAFRAVRQLKPTRALAG